MHSVFSWGKLKAGYQLEVLGVDGTVTLSKILRYRMGVDSSGSGLSHAASFCEHGNEPSGSII
jgi:hypothetical protein